MYCGDDVSSVVFDIGHFNTRAGYSGEDCPRCVVPSQVGVMETRLEKVPVVDEKAGQQDESMGNEGEEVKQDDKPKRTILVG